MTTKSKAIISILGTFVVVGLLVLSSAMTGAKGAELHRIERETAELEKLNREMAVEIVKHSSLTGLLAEAQDEGYVAPQQVVNLNADPAIARLR